MVFKLSSVPEVHVVRSFTDVSISMNLSPRQCPEFPSRFENGWISEITMTGTCGSIKYQLGHLVLAIDSRNQILKFRHEGEVRQNSILFRVVVSWEIDALVGTNRF